MPKPLTVDLKGETEIVVTREFDATRDLVWDCWTVPALIRRWSSVANTCWPTSRPPRCAYA